MPVLCPTCRSARAEVGSWCPHCRHRVPKQSSGLLGLLLLLGLGALIAYGAYVKIEEAQHHDVTSRQLAAQQAAEDLRLQAAEERRYEEARQAREASVAAESARLAGQREAAHAAAREAALRALADMAQNPSAFSSPQPAPASQTYGSDDGYVPSMDKSVHVHGYTKANGTYVQPHTRSAPHR